MIAKTWMVSATAGSGRRLIMRLQVHQLQRQAMRGSQAEDVSGGRTVIRRTVSSTASTGHPGAAGQAGEKAAGTAITFWHSMGGVNEKPWIICEVSLMKNELGIRWKPARKYDAINKRSDGNMGTDLVQIYDIGTRFMIDSAGSSHAGS